MTYRTSPIQPAKNEQQQASFEGWAVVEQMGHNKYAGFVTTQVFGAAALFRIDVPALPEREFRLTQPAFCNIHEEGRTWTPSGTLVKRAASPAYTRLIGPSSIFAITPCSEGFARETLELIVERPLIVLERPVKAALVDSDDQEEYFRNLDRGRI